MKAASLEGGSWLLVVLSPGVCFNQSDVLLLANLLLSQCLCHVSEVK